MKMYFSRINNVISRLSKSCPKTSEKSVSKLVFSLMKFISKLATGTFLLKRHFLNTVICTVEDTYILHIFCHQTCFKYFIYFFFTYFEYIYIIFCILTKQTYIFSRYKCINSFFFFL